MTDQERIANLERRMSEQDIRLTARMDVVLTAMAASQGVAVDALALIAIRDREMVENLMRMRRLLHQTSGSGPLSGEMVKRYQLALDIADQLTSARPLGPQ